MKRRAQVPREALALAEKVSKADLLEAAWSLAALCNEAGSCDDELSTFKRLVEELHAIGRLRKGDHERFASVAELTPARAAQTGSGAT